MNVIYQSILISNISIFRVYNGRPQCFVNSAQDVPVLYSLSIAQFVITSFDVSLNQLESEAVIISEFPVTSCLLVRSSGPEQLYKF